MDPSTQHFVPHAGHGSSRGGSSATRHGASVLCLIVILLLIREIYLTVATISNVSHQSEGIWYPLAALPEVLAVALFAFPGLVPEKKDLVAITQQREKNPEATEMV